VIIHTIVKFWAGIQSKVEELNQLFRNHDRIKDDDAIAQLSDQVMALTARMQEIKSK
jgi:hypothetical protein